MKNLLRNINVLNLILAAAIVFSVTYNPGAALPPGYGRAHGAIRLPGPGKQDALIKDGQAGPGNEVSDSPDSYAIIGRQNLFNPARTIPVEKPPAVAVQPPPKPDLVLRGTLITGGLSLAYIEVRKSAPGFAGGAGPEGAGGPARYGPARHGMRFPYGRPQQPFYGTPIYGPAGQTALHGADAGKVKVYKKGDSIDGFVLTSIEPDEVRLARGKETMDVFLYKPVKDLGGSAKGLPGTNFQTGQPGF
ncbi:MAG: hypothetical protein M0Z75_14095 [Nitrospiraceae bacterium]|nr:hypothetical protein [Nitrospiraceae bacterium]